MDGHNQGCYYRIKDWQQHFENNRTREMKCMAWVPVPNKHDGEGYQRIMQEKDGIIIYGCWHLILQVASKCLRERGTLLRDDDTPITASSLAIKTGWRHEADFQRAMDFLCSPDVAWLERVAINTEEIPHPPAAAAHPPAWNRIEGNRKERREGGGGDQQLPDNPTIPDLVAYIKKCRPEFHNLPAAGFENELKDAPSSIRKAVVMEFVENMVNSVSPPPIPSRLLSGYIRKRVPPKQPEERHRREPRSNAEVEAVRELEEAEQYGQEAVTRCMKVIRDKYKNYGKDAQGKSVLDAAIEMWRERKKNDQVDGRL